MLNTLTVSAAITPTVVQTYISHYLQRGPLHQKPTAHIRYHEGLRLIRTFLEYASHHTVEEIQSFTSQWVPCPAWVRVETTEIGQESIKRAATLLISQLGPEGVNLVGGSKWWQWRRDNSSLRAEWIEMRSDYILRKDKKSRRVMLYVHGGAYFFGSVDEHRYQLQRHARKLRARVFAPRYRLAPQFPFPCGLVDCLSAYIHLLTIQEPEEIILAGDSAGGGMVVALLVILRDQNIPLPAGAVLISPWVDLTHSFPSVAEGGSLDYIPVHGFMHRPSMDWPPEEKDDGLSIEIDGRSMPLKEQMQLYATNQLIFHPLVSPVLQPSLGGLPPLLVLTGGGEVLRDEQIYLAHKAADPHAFPLVSYDYDPEKAILNKHPPTPVQLQVWEDLCHVAPTLSFTRPAKYMYRSIAQFGAWALARAQRRPIEITDDDDVSIISIDWAEMIETNGPDNASGEVPQSAGIYTHGKPSHIGKAGDPIPHFINSMVRQQVDRHGNISALKPASELPALTMPASSVGKIKPQPVRRWLAAKQEWDARYSSQRERVAKRRRKDAAEEGYIPCPGERPPPSALAGRRKKGRDEVEKKTKRSWGLSLWSLWGSKHDESTMKRETEMLETEEAAAEANLVQSPDQNDDRSPPDLPPTSPLSPPPTSPSRPLSRPRTKSHAKSTSSISLSFRSPTTRTRQPSFASPADPTTPMSPWSPRLRRTTVSDLGQVEIDPVLVARFTGEDPWINGGVLVPVPPLTPLSLETSAGECLDGQLRQGVRDEGEVGGEGKGHIT